MLYFIFAAFAAAAYKPTITKPWPTRMQRAKWPSPTEEWGTPPTEFPSDDDSGSGFKFTLPIIIGIAVGCVVFIILIVLVVILIIRKRRSAASPLMGEDSKVQEDVQEQLIK